MERLTIATLAVIISILAATIFWYGLPYLPKSTPSTTSSTGINEPPANVTAFLIYTLDSHTDVVFVNGTVTNDSPNTAYNVGIAIDSTTWATVTYPSLQQGGTVIVPLINGSYNEQGNFINKSTSPTWYEKTPLSNLQPCQSVHVSIAFYPFVNKGLLVNAVTAVWSNKP